MQRWHMLRDPIILEHVEKRRLSGIVQAQEDELSALLRQS